MSGHTKGPRLLHYTVGIAGGFGPHTWDQEFEVEAENFEDALIRAKARLGDRTDWDFTHITEQES